MQKLKKLSVRLHGGIEVGTLEETSAGKMRFKYVEGPKLQLSLSLPIRKEVYSEKECRGYFGGLLPENINTRKMLAMQHKISENNDFALLAAIGGECAGAVSFCKPDEPLKFEYNTEILCRPLSPDGLVKLLEGLPVKPFDGHRMSLAGAQLKTSVCVINGKVARPLYDTFTTHIIKPPMLYKNSVQNEYICMKTAKKTGLNVAEVEARKVKGFEFLLIERFDRTNSYHEDYEIILRKHQEDFAQASGVFAENKYNFSFKDCLKVLEQLTSPAKDKEQFCKCAIYNFLIGNSDAHAKNFSLFLMPDNACITPFYDLLCTTVYDLDNDMAMKIGNAKYAKDVTRKDWEIFASDLDIKPKVVFEELERQMEILPKALIESIQEVDEKFGYRCEIGPKIIEYVNKNIKNVKKYI